MSDITAMALEGVLCAGCGVFLGEDVGYPRYCGGCARDREQMTEDIDETKDWSKEPPVSLLSRGTLSVLAAKHLVEFTKKLAAAQAGVRGYRLDECETYWLLWSDEVSRLSMLDLPPMPNVAFNEYQDALFSGDYDDVLKPEELEALQKYSEETG